MHFKYLNEDISKLFLLYYLGLIRHDGAILYADVTHSVVGGGSFFTLPLGVDIQNKNSLHKHAGAQIKEPQPATATVAELRVA